MRVRIVLAVLAVAGLAACTPGPGSSPSPSGSASTSPSPSGPGGTGSATAKPTPSVPQPTPGRGDAELSIIVKPSATAAALSYTLVCKGGVPAPESHHPTAAAACAALQKNPGLLTRTPRPADQVCDQRYGGPQTATVTGTVDGVNIDSTYKLTDGCEIAAWAAAADVLGSSGAGS
ncbi:MULTISPECIES: SSI family serine proteinase inhibitor [Arthrobacter]|uniref:Serine protease inhibitor n=1 Tax=Arthrobacter terricola TaxID=2547396 RepID=A0A4R5KB17_9MICC|nr:MULTISPECIES: SSI family serine proteinase inhibitor [Arthrobacter]MBT8162302.1 serine protease inhibitor [Arthrobacter sp. GN70]TDF92226.1 serine protease inhibitor [Arthrobacter terricola]